MEYLSHFPQQRPERVSCSLSPASISLDIVLLLVYAGDKEHARRHWPAKYALLRTPPRPRQNAVWPPGSFAELGGRCAA